VTFLDWLAQLPRRAVRYAQQLFHMLVGILFLLLAGAGAAVSLSEWQSYRQAPSVGLVRFSAVAGFTVLLIVLGLYSFVKARSIR
jgi:hypothetical protein